jgi:hypothetical protein
VIILQRQFRGHKNNDPATKHQKAIPPKVLQDMVMRPTTMPLMTAFHQLTLLAFFFAMRSCEYLHIQQADRRTKPLRLRNLEFRDRHNMIIPHDSSRLEHAATITITFEHQKRDLRDDKVTQSRSGHPMLCPVRAGAVIVRCLQSLNASPDEFLCTFKDGAGQKSRVTNKAAPELLRSHVDSINKACGISRDDIGLHSIQSSAAMAMCLNGIPVCTIMLLGHWSSDAFL